MMHDNSRRPQSGKVSVYELDQFTAKLDDEADSLFEIMVSAVRESEGLRKMSRSRSSSGAPPAEFKKSKSAMFDAIEEVIQEFHDVYEYCDSPFEYMKNEEKAPRTSQFARHLLQMCDPAEPNLLFMANRAHSLRVAHQLLTHTKVRLTQNKGHICVAHL